MSMGGFCSLKKGWGQSWAAYHVNGHLWRQVNILLMFSIMFLVTTDKIAKGLRTIYRPSPHRLRSSLVGRRNGPTKPVPEGPPQQQPPHRFRRRELCRAKGAREQAERQTVRADSTRGSGSNLDEDTNHRRKCLVVVPVTAAPRTSRRRQCDDGGSARASTLP
jgi:hypothetical protein